jgi:hypothetical protein
VCQAQERRRTQDAGWDAHKEHCGGGDTPQWAREWQSPMCWHSVDRGSVRRRTQRRVWGAGHCEMGRGQARPAAGRRGWRRGWGLSGWEQLRRRHSCMPAIVAPGRAGRRFQLPLSNSIHVQGTSPKPCRLRVTMFCASVHPTDAGGGHNLGAACLPVLPRSVRRCSRLGTNILLGSRRRFMLMRSAPFCIITRRCRQSTMHARV